MGKKASSVRVFAIFLLALVVVGGLGFGAYKLFGVQQSTVGEVQQLVEGSQTSEFCANNPSVGLDWRVINTEASSAEYLYTTIYVAELDDAGNIVFISEVTGGNVSTRTSSADALACNKNHKLFIKTTQDGNANALVEPIMIEAKDTLNDPVKVDIRTSKFSNVSMRAYDVIDDGLMYANVTGGTVSATTFRSMADSLGYNTTTSGTSAKTVGADDSYEIRVEFKTQIADAEFGSETRLCIDNADDSNPNDWDVPSVTSGSSDLTEIKGTLSGNEILALNSYEYCYDLGYAVGENQKSVTIAMPTGAGVNPDYDWGIKLIALGDYEDDKNPGNLLNDVGFRTDASRTELATASVQTVTFDIS